jgi:hypothetical protein
MDQFERELDHGDAEPGTDPTRLTHANMVDEIDR